MLKSISVHRILLGLNLSLLASLPVAAQVSPNVPVQVQNTLSKPQIENLPAEFRPELRDLNNLNNLGIDNQDNRFVNPRTIPDSKPTQAEPLLTINVPIGLEFGSCPGQIEKAQGFKTNSDGIVIALTAPRTDGKICK